MNDRLKLLRKELQLNQEEFGNRLGVTKASISRLESGINNISEQMTKLICKEFRCDYEWFTTGKGSMFPELSPDEELASFVGDLLSEESDSAKKTFFRAFAKLPDEFFMQMYNAIIDEYKKNE